MIRSMHEPDHPERTRMANVIGHCCSGLDLHRDAECLKQFIELDQRIMERFLQALVKMNDRGIFVNLSPGVSACDKLRTIYTRWMYKTEATYLDEWKKWSENVRK